jgi:hypothetical protein
VPRLTASFFATAITALGLGAAGALPAEPLFDPDNGPLTGLFGWPTSSEGSRLAPAGRNDWRLHASLASHSVTENGNGESLVLDGETTRIWLDWRRGLSHRLEVGAMLPWVRHAPGNLDSLINDWHDFFGLPDGNRGAAPEDRLLFQYARGSSELARLDRSSDGIGDLRIYAGWALRESPDSRLALRLNLKLPTGDSDRLLGSGSTDASIGLAGDVARLWNVAALSGFYRLSALYMGTPDILPAHARHFAGQFAAGLEYRFAPGFAVGAQTTLRSAPFESAAEPLGEWAMSLSAGARFRLPGDWQLQLGFNEDVKVESVPDITLLLSLTGPSAL